MITNKTGKAEMIYSDLDGFRMSINIQNQLKIFNSSAKDAGTIKYLIYNPKTGSSPVKISTIKGTVYNLEDGKIVKTKLERSGIIENQINDFYKELILVMPNIKNNSVIEYEIEYVSEHNRYIPTWIVQQEYPTLYNEFFTSIPTFYDYQINIMGSETPKVDKRGSITRSTTYKNTVPAARGVINSPSTYDQVQIEYLTRRFVFEDILPVESEPYTNNKIDNQARITFQLIHVEFPNRSREFIASSYQKLNEELMESYVFGRILKDNFIKDIIAKDSEKTDYDLAKAVHTHFKKHVKWNGFKKYSSSMKSKELFKEGIGDSGDLNLNYIAALNTLGIKTYPVILSTRGNGTLHPIYPEYSGFNYVIALSMIDDKAVYSDVASSMPFAFIPESCLNQNGWLVSSDGGMWVDLKANASGKMVVQTAIDFDQTSLNYDVTVKQNDYLAFTNISKINSEGMDEFIKESKIKKPDLNITHFEVSEILPSELKLKENIKFDISDPDFILIQPFVNLPFEQNPFTRESRNANVDFPFRQEYKLISTINVPDGYQIELPENMIAVLHEDFISLKYLANYNEIAKSATIVVDFKINKTIYSNLEYQDIKATFQAVIGKLNEPVLMKKLI